MRWAKVVIVSIVPLKGAGIEGPRDREKTRRRGTKVEKSKNRQVEKGERGCPIPRGWGTERLIENPLSIPFRAESVPISDRWLERNPVRFVILLLCEPPYGACQPRFRGRERGSGMGSPEEGRRRFSLQPQP